MALAELVDACAAGDDECQEDERDGEEGDGGEVGPAEELDGAVGLTGGGVEGEEHVDGGSDDHDEDGDDGKVEAGKEEADGLGPAKEGVVGADDALREDEVGDEKEDDAGGGEDLGGDGDLDVGRAGGPDDAGGHGNDAGHAEAEEQAGEEELVVVPAVDLEDGHVEGGAGDEEDEEDGADWDVEGDGGEAAEDGRVREVGASSLGLALG